MRLVLFEDSLAEQFSPIALMRPVFELVCGRYSLRERLELQGRLSSWGVIVRHYLQDVYREEHPGVPVNDFAGWTQRIDPLDQRQMVAHNFQLGSNDIRQCRIDWNFHCVSETRSQ